MNFITYINKAGTYKTAMVMYDVDTKKVITTNPINEGYIVLAVFINSIRVNVELNDCIQLSIINDFNFDGNLLDDYHYNVEGTKFECFVVPPVSTPLVVNRHAVDVLSSVPVTVDVRNPHVSYKKLVYQIPTLKVSNDWANHPAHKGELVPYNIDPAKFKITKTGVTIVSYPIYDNKLATSIQTGGVGVERVEPIRLGNNWLVLSSNLQAPLFHTLLIYYCKDTNEYAFLTAVGNGALACPYVHYETIICAIENGFSITVGGLTVTVVSKYPYIAV